MRKKTKQPFQRNEEDCKVVLPIEVIGNLQVQSVEYSSRVWHTQYLSFPEENKPERKNNLSLYIKKNCSLLSCPAPFKLFLLSKIK